MDLFKFVHEQIVRGALSKGASEKAANDQADQGLEDYKKGRIEQRTGKLIEAHIKLAMKATKGGA